MPRSIKIICAMLVLGLMLCNAQDSAEPSDQPAAAAANSDTTNAIAVVGKPFSAIKYSRTVKVLPDGKQQFIRNEQYPVQLARDSKGRVLLQTMHVQPECDQPESPKPPICPYWLLLIFDPAKQTMTHWVEGEFSGGGTVIIQMTPAQITEAAELTLNVHQNLNEPDAEDSSVTWKSLGQKEIEGVTATGVRTTTMHPPEYPGKTPTKTIHEVWVSTEMKLVIRVIDGNPHGVETISGLEHLSQSPDPSLFIPHPREGFVIYYGNLHPPGADYYFKRKPDYANGDIRDLAEWEVK
jgi:hypothetical protein